MSDRFDPVYGSLDLVPAMRRQQVKGNLVRARARYVRETWGQAAFDALAESLDPEPRAELVTPPLASAWVPVWPMYEIDRAIALGPMAGDVTRMRAFGRDIARYDLPTIYKVILRMLTSPEILLRRIGTVFGMYFKEGLVTCEAEDPNAHVVLSNTVLPLYICTHGMVGFLEAALEPYGVTATSAVHSLCRHRGDATCEWDVSWRKV